jgi:hypothetical protein
MKTADISEPSETPTDALLLFVYLAAVSAGTGSQYEPEGINANPRVVSDLYSFFCYRKESKLFIPLISCKNYGICRLLHHKVIIIA